MKIYTVGHSTRTFEDFLKILKFYKIELVVDVRRFPMSKKFPYFNKENFENELPRNKIEYLHYPELGGFRKEGYEAFTKTEEFSKAIEKLLEIIDEKVTAIMCAEWNVMKCHRWYISEELIKLKHEIFHIINETKVQSHLDLPKRKPKAKCELKIKI